jgi:group I intron endonuclease
MKSKMPERVDRLPNESGVYLILCIPTGKVYVGSAAGGIRWRISNHLSTLRNGYHDNMYLQRAWNKYGEDAFEFFVMCLCPKEECVSLEQYWIDYYDSTNSKVGYNLAPKAGSMLGYRHSEEGKQKISEHTKRAMSPEEVRTRLRTSSRRRWSDPNARKKSSVASKKMWETCPKLAIKRIDRVYKEYQSVEAWKQEVALRVKRFEERTGLSDEDVLEIRRRYKKGSHQDGMSALSREFKLKHRVIELIIRRRIWRHL